MAQRKQNQDRGSNLTREDRAAGGRNSSGNFKNDPERASEVARKANESRSSEERSSW